MSRIVIYVGAGDRVPTCCVLSLLCDRWRAAGVEVVERSRPLPDPSDAPAFLHVDTTRRPQAFEPVLQRHPRVINGRVTDISKRRISDQLLRRGSDYAGPVIVKSDANYFGIPDRSFHHPRGNRVRKCVASLLDRVFVVTRRIRSARTYPIYRHLSEVPWLVWWDRRLVVEKFLPEQRDGLYCTRSWLFLGSREVVALNAGPVPVVKRENVVRSERIVDVPAAIRAARERWGFDYGKIDFVLHDGGPVLLDMNLTPTTSATPSPRVHAVADELAPGLEDFHPQPVAGGHI